MRICRGLFYDIISCMNCNFNILLGPNKLCYVIDPNKSYCSKWLVMYILCYYSFTNVSCHETLAQYSHFQFNSHPVNNLITYYEVWPFSLPHKYCRSCYCGDTRLKSAFKVQPSLNSPLVIISLVQAVPILDCLERDAVSRFVGASSFVFQGESEAQTSCKYVNGCYSRASVAEPGCR